VQVQRQLDYIAQLPVVMVRQAYHVLWVAKSCNGCLVTEAPYCCKVSFQQQQQKCSALVHRHMCY
jgi:hypothetical protein